MASPIPLIAPTIVRFSFQHSTPVGRLADMIADISLDETGVSRSEAVNTLVPLVVGVWQENIAAGLLGGVTFTGAQWIDLDSLDSISGFQGPVSGKPVNGGTSDAIFSVNVAYLIHKQCSHTRTQRNGRMFIPGVKESVVDNAGTVATGTVTGLTNQVEGFRTDINDLSATGLESVAWRVVHVEGHAPSPDNRPNAWSSSDISHAFCDTKVATQRRRLRG